MKKIENNDNFINNQISLKYVQIVGKNIIGKKNSEEILK